MSRGGARRRGMYDVVMKPGDAKEPPPPKAEFREARAGGEVSREPGGEEAAGASCTVTSEEAAEVRVGRADVSRGGAAARRAVRAKGRGFVTGGGSPAGGARRGRPEGEPRRRRDPQ